MKTSIRYQISAVTLLLSITWVGLTSTKPVVAQTSNSKTTVSEKSIRSYMNALASDEMRGRGSATADELGAAKYIASQMKLLKIAPAGQRRLPANREVSAQTTRSECRADRSCNDECDRNPARQRSEVVERDDLTLSSSRSSGRAREHAGRQHLQRR